MRSATASACARSILSLRKARSVNSPGRARRAPSASTRSTSRSTITGTAVALQLEHVLAGVRMRAREEERDTDVDRMCRRASRKRARVAWRGSGSSPTSVAAISGVFGSRHAHDADAAASGRCCRCHDGVGMAHASMGRRRRRPRRRVYACRRADLRRDQRFLRALVLRRDFPVDVPLLQDRQTGVRHPVEHQAGGEQREHDREHERHELEDLRLHRVRRRRIQLVLDPHRQAVERGQDEERIARRQIVDPAA